MKIILSCKEAPKSDDKIVQSLIQRRRQTQFSVVQKPRGLKKIIVILRKVLENLFNFTLKFWLYFVYLCFITYILRSPNYYVLITILYTTLIRICTYADLNGLCSMLQSNIIVSLFYSRRKYYWCPQNVK